MLETLRSNKIKGRIIVTTVICLIVFIAFTSQFFVIWPFLESTQMYPILILIPLNYFIVMTLINYCLTCMIHPGSVPTKWIPKQLDYIEVKKSTHTPRFCKTCNDYKPPRTHHCSRCNSCVLKMDHHCPWVDNCIGFKNYCHFVRFLFYIDLSIVYILVLLSCRLAQIVIISHRGEALPTALELTFVLLNMIVLTIALIAVGFLSVYHVYCISTNTTTIEGWEKGRSLTIKGMGKIQNIKCPYDQGIYRNIQSVLGENPLFWFIPKSMKGSGLDFPLSLKYLEGEEKTISASHSIQSQFSNATLVTIESKPHLSLDITKVQPLKTKTSMRSVNFAVPNTPGSILTLASTTTTLVDSHHYSQHYFSKIPFRKKEPVYSLS